MTDLRPDTLSGEVVGGWVTDVTPNTTITSTWGNAIRNRTVAQFTNKAQRDAAPAPAEGALCVTVDTHIVYQRVGSVWWVVAMPWRDFTPAAWQQQVGGDPPMWFPMNLVQTYFAKWRQSMGAAQITASFLAGITVSNLDQYVATRAPITPAVNIGGPAGASRIWVNATGLAHGGSASLLDNAGSPGSRVWVNNVGAGVLSNAVIRVPAGNQNLVIDQVLSFPCDPTTDTP